VRKTDADRIESLLERSRFRVDSAQKGLGMRDGGRPGEHGERRQLGRQSSEEAPADRTGEEAEEPAEREVGDPVDCLSIVRITLEHTAQGGRVQRERDADQGRPARERPLEVDGELPAPGGGRLEQ
jgi:hypothetical protein